MKSIIQIFWLLAIVIVATVGYMAYGVLSPRPYTTSYSVTINHSPQVIFPFISNVDSLAGWMGGLYYFEPPAADGSRRMLLTHDNQRYVMHVFQSVQRPYSMVGYTSVAEGFQASLQIALVPDSVTHTRIDVSIETTYTGWWGNAWGFLINLYLRERLADEAQNLKRTIEGSPALLR